MDFLIVLKALMMGLVEGFTEFLPISSTGHLIVFGNLIGFHSNHKVFEIAIQLGAVLAVVFEYRQRFSNVLHGVGKDRKANRFVLNLAIAFIPAAVMGLLFDKQIKEYLFNPLSVAVMLVLGGFFILWVEKRQSRAEPKIADVDALRPIDALMIGVAQVFAWLRVRPVRAVRLWAGCFGESSGKRQRSFHFSYRSDDGCSNGL